MTERDDRILQSGSVGSPPWYGRHSGEYIVDKPGVPTQAELASMEADRRQCRETRNVADCRVCTRHEHPYRNRYGELCYESRGFFDNTLSTSA